MYKKSAEQQAEFLKKHGVDVPARTEPAPPAGETFDEQTLARIPVPQRFDLEDHNAEQRIRKIVNLIVNKALDFVLDSKSKSGSKSKGASGTEARRSRKYD